jgi:predicted glutamine amidotransferase
MCIIVAKPKNVSMPSEETMRMCFTNNPDGAGFMLNHNGRVYGFKGLMTFDDFLKKLKQVERRFGNLREKGVVMHFRIGTHGTNIPANTHPFPVTNDYRRMRKTNWIADQGMAHNGIIYKTSSHQDVKKNDVSDTMVFNRYCVAPLARFTNITTDQKTRDILEMIASSKLAFMDGTGKISTCGSFERVGGILYSNSSYKQAKYKTQNKYTSTAKTSGYYGSYGYSWDDEIFEERWGAYRGTLHTPSNYATSTSTSTETKTTGYNWTPLIPEETPALPAPAESGSGSKATNITVLSADEIKEKVKLTAASEDGLLILKNDITIYAPEEDFDGQSVSKGHAYDPFTGDVYYWNSKEYVWDLAYRSNDICLFDEAEYRFIFISDSIRRKMANNEVILTSYGLAQHYAA